MVKITYIEYDGTKHTVDVDDGMSVMEGAVNNSIPGIDADCGGACACATCMVFVPPEWWDRLPEKQDMEETMLSFCDHSEENSRLTCQLEVSSALDGLTVFMPKTQH
ncbi:MAG: 2Fe-2S iron-sulfur cluster-binding protein [Parvularculales bacterium]